MPLVSAFTAGGSGVMRCVLLNRSATSDLLVRLTCLGGASGAAATVYTLDATDPPLPQVFGRASTPDWISASVAVAADTGVVTASLPAHPAKCDQPHTARLGVTGAHGSRRHRQVV
jgi:hypothetical protein